MSAPADYTPPSTDESGNVPGRPRSLGENNDLYHKRLRKEDEMKELLDQDILRTIPVEEWTTEEYRMMVGRSAFPFDHLDVSR